MPWVDGVLMSGDAWARTGEGDGDMMHAWTAPCGDQRSVEDES